MSNFLKPRVVDDGFLKRWIKGSITLVNRRLMLFFVSSSLSIFIGVLLINVWGLFYLGLTFPLVVLFCIPLLSDKSDDISAISSKDILPMVYFSIKISLFFFILIAILMVVMYSLLMLIEPIKSESIMVIDKILDVVNHPILSSIIERVSNTFSFILFFIAPLSFVFYTMLYSGLSGKDSFYKIIDDTTIIGRSFLTIIQASAFLSVIMVILHITLSSLFDSIYFYILYMIIILYVYSLSISVCYMAFKDIYLNSGDVEHEKVKSVASDVTAEYCRNSA